MNYKWKDLSRAEKTSIITSSMMKDIYINGGGYRIGLKEININIGKYKKQLRIDILEINKRKNVLIGYEIKSCIQDFRTDKKWEKYLDLVNKMYFVFDNETFENYREEILKKIKNKAGVYVYNINRKMIFFVQDGKYFNLEEKNEMFYRIILFNYLWRKANIYFNNGVINKL